MQKINLIAQGVLELSHREKSGRQRQQRHPSGLNYSPRRNVFRRGQKKGLSSRISKNPSAVQRGIPKEGTMQNSIQFGRGTGDGKVTGHFLLRVNL